MEEKGHSMATVQERDDVFTIQQMVQMTGLSAHTLRYYERAGLMLQRVGRDGSSGYRHYTRQDAQWFDFIKRLRATGMPIRDVQRYANLLRLGDGTVAERLQSLQDHRRRVQAKLDEVEQHLAYITKKITCYEEIKTHRLELEPR
jgi:DNA-binding transcriptional MerR regulator